MDVYFVISLLLLAAEVVYYLHEEYLALLNDIKKRLAICLTQALATSAV